MFPRSVSLVPVFVLSLVAAAGRVEAQGLSSAVVRDGYSATPAGMTAVPEPGLTAVRFQVPAPKH